MNRDLELAERVFPDDEWDANCQRVFRNNSYRDTFDPLGEHFHNVLAWLACQTDVHITGDCVATQLCIRDYAAGTAAGIAQAVYEAAIRIVEAEE